MAKKKKGARGARDGALNKRQERIDRAAHRKQRQKKRYGKQYTDDELAKFQEELSSKGFTLRESKGDGNCFFRSASIQLTGSEASHYEVRETCVDYIEANPDVFLPFVEDEDESFAEYCIRMRGDAEWGGQPELMALSWSRHLNIMVHQWKEPSYLVECGKATAPVIHLSYHDGNHYNSVHPDVTAAAMTRCLLQGDDAAGPTDTTVANVGPWGITVGASAGTDEAMVMACTGLDDMARIKEVLDDMGGDVSAAIQFIDVELQANAQADAETAGLIAATQDESAVEAAMIAAATSASAEMFETETAASVGTDGDESGSVEPAATGQGQGGDGTEGHREASAGKPQDGEGHAAPRAEKRMTKRDKKKKKREQKREQLTSRRASAVARAEAKADKSGLNGDAGWDVLRM